MNFPDDLAGIDMHVHLSDAKAQSYKVRRGAQMATYFSRSREPVPIDDLAAMYRERKMMACLMNSIDRTVTGDEPLPNDYIAEVVQAHPDVFLGFGAVDPREGRRAELEVERCRGELGLVGIGELNPARQHFAPSDPDLYGVWRAAEACNLVVLFHGGFAAAGAGTPGGMGVKLKYSRPILIDDVAADFPQLRIVCAHPAWPWESEAMAIALHKANVYLDLSGWAPRYFSAELRHYINSRIAHKALFGSDWPSIPLERWLDDFAELDLKPEVRRKIMVDNARALFSRS